MDKVTQLIFENIISGKIDKKVGTDILKNLKLEEKRYAKEDIAIIGMSLKFPSANDVEMYWDNLKNGVDCITEFPENRKKDVEGFIPYTYVKDRKNIAFCPGGYLDEIDRFDYKFFGLSPKEASLMDPNQRLFLQTAWNTLEDAGYGGKKLVGSRTGLYIGYSGWPMYGQFVSHSAPEALTISIAGNISAIIASRIPYLLDFRGPSMLVDTACSSSLVALHLACEAIKNGDCEQAIAGGIRTILLPVEGMLQYGIESTNFRAKAFDDSADGTSLSEGVAAVFLKPLRKAVKDRDHVYAVIKGSAINQDGSSIGITAPNVLAQEDVIIKAWEDAGVNPETISYIEAHGTGTKLGDPIEIDGLQKAFRRYTNKKQFCAIASVKSNMGHLDCTAGIAGLIKAVLALKEKQIPPSLHFESPNRKISFEQSPVYVNDRLIEWESEEQPRRCGVSSFGFSGTNCHVVLEEVQQGEEENRTATSGIEILAMSAKSLDTLKMLVKEYDKFLEKEPSIHLKDLCYTANTGRGHYNHRLTMIVKDKEDLKGKLQKLMTTDWSEIQGEDIFYGKHKIVPLNKERRREGEITSNEAVEMTQRASLKLEEFASQGKNNKAIAMEMCKLYTSGGEMAWDDLYEEEMRRRVSLPTYPFERSRCWLEITDQSKENEKVHKEMLAPLLDQYRECMDQEVYFTQFDSQNHWEIREHKIFGQCVLVGTSYLEMAAEVSKKYFPQGKVELRDITFLTPLVVNKGEVKEVQTSVKKVQDHFEFVIASKTILEEEEGAGGWIKHVEGKIFSLEHRPQKKYDLKELKSKCNESYHTDVVTGEGSSKSLSVFEFGPRWDNVKEIYSGKKELLIRLQIPEAYAKELGEYVLHPALLDKALMASTLLDSDYVKDSFDIAGDEVFLPFMYKRVKIEKALPSSFYSFIRVNDPEAKNPNIVSFDAELLDNEGNVLVQIENYCIKKAPKSKLSRSVDPRLFSQVGWIKQDITEPLGDMDQQCVLILKDKKGFGERLSSKIRENGAKVIEVQWGTQFEKMSDHRYCISESEGDQLKLIESIKDQGVTKILHLFTLGMETSEHDMGMLQDTQNRGVYNLLSMTKALVEKKASGDIDIWLISDHVSEVTKRESYLNPYSASLFGLGKVVGQEYPKIRCRSIDVDHQTDVEQVLKEIRYFGSKHQGVAYRNGNRYVQCFEPMNIVSCEEHAVQIRNQGVYVITGGTGGLGLEMCKFLSSQNKVNLVLINRSQLPGREEWQAIVESGANGKLSKKLHTLREIEASGSQVISYNTDLSNMEELKKILENVRGEFGNIDGVLHCAGIAGDGFLIQKDLKQFKQVMLPKIEGTWMLHELTKEDKLDFFVMFSSITSILGAPGQGDYTAANSFLDAFAPWMAKAGQRALSINWAGWQETGMAVDYGVHEDAGVFHTLKTSTAVQALEQAWNKKITNVVIGALNDQVVADLQEAIPLELSDDIKRRLAMHHSDNTNKLNAGTCQEAMRVLLKGRMEEEYSDIERKVAQVWAQLFGLKEMDIYEDFGEMGGDSILAAQLVVKMGEVFPEMIDITDIFTYPSIVEMAGYIASSMPGGSQTPEESESMEQDEDLDEILKQLEEGTISVSEAGKRI